MNSSIDFRQLLAFKTLVKEGSFTKTGLKLGLTQSAISHAIKGLENQLECRILTRLNKTIQLTQEGEILLKYADKILNDVESIHDALKSLNPKKQGHIRIGCSASISQFILPIALREFRVCFPQYLISLRQCDSPEAVKLLESNNIDIAFLIRTGKEKNLSVDSFFTDGLKLLTCPQHPWAKKGTAVESEYLHQNFILYNKNSVTYDLITDYLKLFSVNLKSTTECGNIEAIKEMVKLRIGISMVAPWTVKTETREGTLITISPGKKRIKREWLVAYSAHRKLNLSEQTLVGLCQSVAENLLLQT